MSFSRARWLSLLPDESLGNEQPDAAWTDRIHRRRRLCSGLRESARHAIHMRHQRTVQRIHRHLRNSFLDGNNNYPHEHQIFFIKDRLAANALWIKPCPTEVMWWDFFMKPLQGQPFFRMRDQIMNIVLLDKRHDLMYLSSNTVYRCLR